ncbi:hypothetical protein AJ80_10033 [Polytolypa hystricis UAMH7299]|uniref:Uncharacterized protein n=1 Tax=Polytolypa hystricis (strain UAMH7299) TaxID=1447883 RepID=A0A2B7WEW2_POLH7|nr:hypothetical protein AJ80_10033 [Polytolypa hystricis UAMH7299]
MPDTTSGSASASDANENTQEDILNTAGSEAKKNGKELAGSDSNEGDDSDKLADHTVSGNDCGHYYMKPSTFCNLQPNKKALLVSKFQMCEQEVQPLAIDLIDYLVLDTDKWKYLQKLCASREILDDIENIYTVNPRACLSDYDFAPIVIDIFASTLLYNTLPYAEFLGKLQDHTQIGLEASMEEYTCKMFDKSKGFSGFDQSATMEFVGEMCKFQQHFLPKNSNDSDKDDSTSSESD